jgi:hypothetical protein
MLKKHSYLLVILLALSFLLSACSGALAANSWPGLTTDNTNIYVANAQHVYAVRASDNTMVWRFPSDKAGVGFFGAPQLTKDGQLIFGGFDKILYSVNPQTGVQNWTFTDGTDRYIGPVLVTDTAIYAPNADHNLYALDLHGAKKWVFKATNMLWAQPLTDGKLIYLSSMDHFLYALNLDGQLQWKADLGGAILGTPTMSPDQILYVGTLNNELLAVKASDGSIVWRFTTSGGVWAGPALNANNLYFGDMKGTFYVLDRTTHQPLTSFQPDGPIVGTPLVLADKKEVMFGTEAAALIAVDLSGKQLWSTNPAINGKLYSSPLLVGDRVVVAVTQGDQLLLTLDQDGKSVVNPFIPPK